MKEDWTNRPTKINIWNSNIDYVMFVDENGNSDISNILKCVSQRKEIDMNDKFFNITGCIFSKDNYIEAKEKISNLKYKYWENGCFEYKNGLQKVCFHSRDIRRHDGAFDDKIINYSEFIADLSNLMNNLNYTIISVAIDKEQYLLQHYHYNTYNTAMCFLIQRYIYVMHNNCKGLVMLEARGKNEDTLLLNELKHIIFETGIKNIPSSELKEKISGIYFNPKWNKGYDDTFSGLEIADLSSYPIYKYVRSKIKDKAFNVLENKIDKFPTYINKGLKIFP